MHVVEGRSNMSKYRSETRGFVHGRGPRLARIAAFAAWISLAIPHVVRPETLTSAKEEISSSHRVSGDALESVVKALEAELQLAESRSYYLVLDPDPQRLRLMHHGVLLHEVTVHSVEIGTPRVLFARRSDPAEAFDRTWMTGRLTPARVRARTEIDTTPDSTDVPIPPLPEELYPTPERFWVRFAGGLAVEFAPDSTASALHFGRRLSEFFASVRGKDHWRARVEMGEEEVGRLYRSLPDSCAFLLVSTPTHRTSRGETAKTLPGR